MLLGMMILIEKEASLKVYWGRKVTSNWTDYEEANTRHNFVGKKVLLEIMSHLTGLLCLSFSVVNRERCLAKKYQLFK